VNPPSYRTTSLVILLLAVAGGGSGGIRAQVPVEGEVRQLVTFAFQPGRTRAALELYRDRVLPLYAGDEALLTFRAFREVESPVPMDLLVVRAFRGMEGMDASGDELRERAAEAGTSLGALYGEIAALSTGHTDEFVEMRPGHGGGDPAAMPLTVFVRFRIQAGSRAEAERVLGAVADGDLAWGVPSSTGRFLIGDGWDYLKILGFPDLADVQQYFARLDETPEGRALDALVSARRTTILGALPDLAIR
jgi:hypothetical protein